MTLALEALDDALPRPMRFDFSIDEIQQRLDELLPLLEQHALENVVAMAGHDDGRWRMRVLW